MKYLTFKELLHTDIEEVIVQSYGYDEGRINHCYQPFKNKRNIHFRVVRFNPTEVDPTDSTLPTLDGYLSHNTFWLKEDEYDLTFILKDDGKVYLDDPDIGADIDY